MFSRFFIERPRFAMVISLVLTLAGVIAVFSLPIALYPQITPPEVVVTASYPGASAEVIAKTVGIPLEEEVNGIEKDIPNALSAIEVIEDGISIDSNDLHNRNEELPIEEIEEGIELDSNDEHS